MYAVQLIDGRYLSYGYRINKYGDLIKGDVSATDRLTRAELYATMSDVERDARKYKEFVKSIITITKE